MRRYLPAILLLGGCWPRIPGGVDDYVDPDPDTVSESALSLFGLLAFTVAQGDYWSDASDGTVSGAVAVLTFVQGNAPSPLADFGEIGTCAPRPGESPFFEGIDPGGPATVALEGDGGTVDLEWLGDQIDLYYAEIPGSLYGPRIDWSVTPFDVDAGTIDPGVVVRTPRETEITSPPVSGAEIQTVPRRDTFDVAWRATVGQHIPVVQIVPTNDAFESIGNMTCILEPGSTEAQVPVGEIPAWDEAVGAFVVVGLYDEDTVAIGDFEGQARFGAILQRQGYVRLQ